MTGNLLKSFAVLSRTAMLGVFAEFECHLKRERRIQGIA